MTKSLASVDVDMCHRVASILQEMGIPADKEDVAIAELSGPEIANLFLLVVGICHQTQTLHGHIESESVRGWDYLWRRMLQTVRDNREWLVPAFWSEVTATMLESALHDRSVGDTLSRAEERAGLIRDLGKQMIGRHWESANDMYRQSNRMIGNKAEGLLHYLALFQAYDDPVEKKSFYFLGLMQNSNSWVFIDQENLGAPVDYHEIRGHIRIGTISIHDVTLRRKLTQREPISREDDIAIRSCVRAAIKEIAARSETTSMGLHYLFWNVFRNVCRREKPYCTGCPISCGLPERYQHLLLPKEGLGSCPFIEICRSANSASPIVEYQFNTTWY